MKSFEKQLTIIIIFASYYYFRNISLLCPLLHEINDFLMLIFTPEILQKCMGSEVEGLGTMNFDIPPTSFTMKLLITFDFQHFLN